MHLDEFIANQEDKKIQLVEFFAWFLEQIK